MSLSAPLRTCTNRRDFLTAILGGTAGMSFALHAYGQAAPAPIKADMLTSSIVNISGDGGNIGLVIADDGLMQIDGGYANRVAELQKAIAEVNTHPVRLLFNTHWHGDHVGSNEFLGAKGVKIMAHANAKKWLTQKVVSEAFGTTVEPLRTEGIPGEIVTGSGKMKFGKEQVDYFYFPLAHTDNDLYLFFPASNVLHTGDLFFNTTYPVIDYSTGGWIGGMHAALDQLLKVGNAQTKIIPGHGPVATKADMRASRDMLQEVHNRLEKLSKQGMSMDDVLKAAPTKDLDEKWGMGFMKTERFLKMAYPSLAKHAQKV